MRPGSAPKDGGHQGLYCTSVDGIVADALGQGVVKSKAVALHILCQIHLDLQQQGMLS